MSFEQWLGFREATKAHRNHLINAPQTSNPAVTKPVYRQLDMMLKEIFDDQPTIFGAQKITPARPSYRDWPAGFLTHLFYRQRLSIPPLIVRGNEAGIAIGVTPEDCIQEFISEIFMTTGSKIEHRPRSQVSVLTGPIGCGKSAFVKDILASDQIFDWVASGEGWFLRINLERIVQPARFAKADFYREIVNRVRRLTEKSDEWADVGLSLDKGQKEQIRKKSEHILSITEESIARHDVIEFLNYLTREVFRRRRIVLILDNVDFVFHQADELASAKITDGRIEYDDPNSEVFFSFYDLVKELAEEDGDWSRVGANILLVVRDDTFDAIQIDKTSSGGRPATFLSELRRFATVHSTTSVAALVLLSRLTLLQMGIRCLVELEMQKSAAASRLPKDDLSELSTLAPRSQRPLTEVFIGACVKVEQTLALAKKAPSTHQISRLERVATDAKNIGQAIVQGLAGGRPTRASARYSELATRLTHLSAGGLRDVIRMFQTFAWVKNEYQVLADSGETASTETTTRVGDRIMQRTPLATMVQVLGQMCRYSEEGSKFPNIFLAYGREILESTTTAIAPDYWLVPLILSHLYRSGNTSLASVVNTFCEGSSAEGESVPYQRDLILGTLMRLQRIDGPRVLKFAKVPNFKTRNLRYPSVSLTDRGRELMWSMRTSSSGEAAADGGNFASSFLYLQLVIDDPDIPLPPEFFDGSKIEMAIRRQPTGLPIKRGDSPPFSYRSGFDHGYMVRDDYPTTVAPVVNHKLAKLSRFLGYLSAAQKIERSFHQCVWDRVGVENNGWIFQTRDLLERNVAEAKGRAPNPGAVMAGLDPVAEYEAYETAYAPVLSSIYGGKR